MQGHPFFVRTFLTEVRSRTGLLDPELLRSLRHLWVMVGAINAVAARLNHLRKCIMELHLGHLEGPHRRYDTEGLIRSKRFNDVSTETKARELVGCWRRIALMNRLAGAFGGGRPQQGSHG